MPPPVLSVFADLTADSLDNDGWSKTPGVAHGPPAVAAGIEQLTVALLIRFTHFHRNCVSSSIMNIFIHQTTGSKQ